MKMVNGKHQRIWISSDGHSVIAEGLKRVGFDFQIFDAIIKKPIR